MLSNSLKFNTGQPRISITVQAATLHEITASDLDSNLSYVKIRFSDNGIGFEPEFSEQIFTIFQRLNTRQKFSGTGIGLAMCKKIVDNHHGSIKAEVNSEQGATFVVYLPLKQEISQK
ncbi:hypothetical protein CNR22_14070 [Sphingobacteriaceae bacterium]|nr:hypothetical protein CNR22_14070 [Sphingobacteriaceae bacterium]